MTHRSRGIFRRVLLVAMLSVGTLDVCSAAEPAPPTPPPMPGSDRDAHGCKPSAGYLWCAYEQRCVRPWELARERGLDASFEAFVRFCRRDATSALEPAERH